MVKMMDFIKQFLIIFIQIKNNVIESMQIITIAGIKHIFIHKFTTDSLQFLPQLLWDIFVLIFISVIIISLSHVSVARINIMVDVIDGAWLYFG